MAFPRMLHQKHAALACVAGTHAEILPQPESKAALLLDLSQEFFPGIETPPVVICDLSRGSYGAAFARLMEKLHSKPSFESLSRDKESLEYLVSLPLSYK